MPNIHQRKALGASVQREPRWAAVMARDPDADGRFFYSVETTGVFCRPSCGARRPRPENVAFHESAAAARAAGFRPCKRCKPDEPTARERRAVTVTALCRFIESAETPPTLAQLALRAGLSPFHTHRLFRNATGLTPRAYAAALRARRVRAELSKRATVTEAIYAAGYSGGGRFYEVSNPMLGMTPRRYRDGGVDTEIRFAIGACSLGSILVAATPRGVCALFLGDDPEALAHELERRFPRARLIGGDGSFEELVAKVVGLVERPRLGADLPLDIRGTAFQQRVWQALRKIPVGKTVTYAQLAEAIGAPKASRAVASACAANAVALLIPCHRVIRKDADLAGYRWGVERKRALLERERPRAALSPGPPARTSSNRKFES